MKTLRNLFIFMLLAAVLLAGCTGTKDNPKVGAENNQPVIDVSKYPEYYAELSNLIGKSKAEVLEVLNLQEGDLEEAGENTYIYYTPISVDFKGVSFRLLLGLVADKLNSFRYWAEYENDPENAAKDAETVAAYLASAMNGPNGAGEIKLKDITEEKMLEAFSGTKSMQAFYYWKLTAETTQAHKDYIAELEKIPKLLPKGGAYCLEFVVNYITEINTAHIKLDFGITHDRNINATVAEES